MSDTLGRATDEDIEAFAALGELSVVGPANALDDNRLVHCMAPSQGELSSNNAYNNNIVEMNIESIRI